ncbi:DUF4031 domain-containing protein [Leucobacter allii]|uniref:DUF4031 domain-containing protein n=1 Tax=Leucobacter allii TaxID=2932247 RepID=A0ABY4FGU2_9MICO|nr:DUF4031 domain-containing protein [Leucobacter allii]UOQ55898.1 DUF4031 domain-containing protein [Leucobacter allii]
MAILIDPPAWPAHGTLWSHLVSNADYAELHAFAARLGLPRRGFDLDHYDVPAARYADAVAAGARPVTAKDVVHELRAAGLRVRQRDRDAVAPLRRREYLAGEWASLGARLGIAAGSGTVTDGAAESAATPADAWRRLGDDLLGRWGEAHRRYHDARHLEDVLLALDMLGTRGERIAPETLLAAWFHDAVYAGAGSRSQADGIGTGDARADGTGAGAETAPGADERASARLAAASLGSLGIDPELAQRVAAHIEATAPGHAEAAPAAPERALLLDADLAIFGASPSRYAEYAAAVREEYAHVPDADFAAGRTAILAGYLARPAIYRTAAAQGLWEARARENVGAEIARLERSRDAERA